MRAEPGQQADPAFGLVWQAIVDQVDRPGSDSEWISVADMRRAHLAKFPWNLSGGGAGDVVGMLESKGKSLTGFVSDIGMTILTLEDDVYVFPRNLGSRLRLADLCSNLVIGDGVRAINWPQAILSLCRNASLVIS